MRRTSKHKIDDIIEEFEDENEEVSNENDFSDKEFKQLEDDIELDINHINSKLSEIQKYITLLEIIINNLQNELVLEQDQRKKVYLSKTILVYIEKLTLLQDTYHKYLSLKQDYRSEQNKVIVNKNKLKLDLSKQESNIGNIAGMTQLLDIFKKISSADTNKFIKEVNEELNDDLYKID